MRRGLSGLATLALTWSAAACGAGAPTTVGAASAPPATPATPALETHRVPADPEPAPVAISAVVLPPMLEVTLENGIRLSVAARPGELAVVRCTIDGGATGEPAPGATRQSLERVFAAVGASVDVTPDASVVRAHLLAQDLEPTLVALGEAFRVKKADAFTRSLLVAPRLHVAVVSREDPQRVADWVTAAFRSMSTSTPANRSGTPLSGGPQGAGTTEARSADGGLATTIVLRPGPATRATVDLARAARIEGDAATIAAILVASPDVARTASSRRRAELATGEVVAIVRTWIAEDAVLQQDRLAARKRAARAALEAAITEPPRLADWLATARRSRPSFSLVDLFPAVDAVDAASAAAAARSLAGAPVVVTIEGALSDAQRSELEALGTVVDAPPVR